MPDDAPMTADAGYSPEVTAAGPARQLIDRAWSGSILPVIIVSAAIIALWYVAAIWMNAPFQRDIYARADTAFSTSDLVKATLSQERPVLPAPHQVMQEIDKTVFRTKVTSKRSLVHHAGITLSSTLLGFLMGTVLGIALSVGIIHSRALDRSLMPWIITSQTIPILAIAPMIIVVLNAIGISGLLPKAIISAYLSFFPVAVGMVKGLRSPDLMHLDLMRTYNASRSQVFWKLRWPSAMPFLFASMKVAIAISLVGAIIGELPTGAVAGLGARLLAGSYYGQTIQIWSALIVAALLAAVLVGIVGIANRIVLKRMGMAQ
jgi:NitT/TauT family transport system permease protein